MIVSNDRVIALMFAQIALGGDLVSFINIIEYQHETVAQYYDLPFISMRNTLLPLVLSNTSLLEEYFFIDNEIGVDTRHVNPLEFS
jgi:hypothetical protein